MIHQFQCCDCEDRFQNASAYCEHGCPICGSLYVKWLDFRDCWSKFSSEWRRLTLGAP